MRVEFELTDQYQRRLGNVGRLWKIEGGFGAEFEPGSEYHLVEEIFASFQSMHDQGGDPETALERLKEIEPKLRSRKDGSLEDFEFVMITKGPERYMVTLLPARNPGETSDGA